MRRFENFLRVFRRTPRREFSESLYQRISGKKSTREAFRQVAVWGLVSVLLFYSLSTTFTNFDSQGISTHLSEQNEAQVNLRTQRYNSALVAESGLQPAEFSPRPDEDDLLGPFDKPKHEPAIIYEEIVVLEIEMAVLAVRR
jgi:hypothetical protein